MKYLLLLPLFLMACTKETQTVTVQADNSRVEQLEKSLQLNFQNDALLAARVAALEANQYRFDVLQAEIDALQASQNSQDSNIQQLIGQYTAQQQQINNMSTMMNTSMAQLNVTVNNYINSSNVSTQALDALNASIANLTQRVTQLEQNGATDQELADLRLYVNNNFVTIAMFNALQQQVTNINNTVVNLNNTVTNLNVLVNSGNSVTMVKAPCSNSKEYFMKVGGKYYGAMNVYGQCDDLDMVYLAELAVNALYQTTDGTNCKFKVTSSGTLQQQ